MKIRIEFGPAKSDGYAWAVRLAKKLPTYRETVEEGLTVHAVEFSDIETFLSFQRVIGNWSKVAYYLNERPAGPDHLWEIYYKKYPAHGTLQPMELEDTEGGYTYFVPAGSVRDAEVVGPEQTITKKTPPEED